MADGQDAVWTDWAPANNSTFAMRYRRSPVLRVKNCFESKTPSGAYSGLLRYIMEFSFHGQRFEIEEVLDKPDGDTAFCLVRAYNQKGELTSEHRYPRYQDAEIYVVEHCQD